VTAEYLEEPGGMYADATEHNLRDLEGEGNISLVSDDKKGPLTGFFRVHGEDPSTGVWATGP
jgi:hypothetical protein